MLTVAEPHLDRSIHPTVICRAYMKALEDAVEMAEKLSFNIDFDNREELLKVIDSCIATKFTRRFGNLIPVRPSLPRFLILSVCLLPALKLSVPSSCFFTRPFFLAPLSWVPPYAAVHSRR